MQNAQNITETENNNFFISLDPLKYGITYTNIFYHILACFPNRNFGAFDFLIVLFYDKGMNIKKFFLTTTVFTTPAGVVVSCLH